MIKNYTSKSPIVRSINDIEQRLVKHGAKNILKVYEDQKLTGIAFIISMPDKSEIPFKLPARIDRVEKRLKSVIKKPRKGTMQRISDQAERTAWKLLADWVDIQISLIELDQADLVEVFMPYIYDHSKKKTLFDKMKDSKFLLLSDGGRKND